MSIGISLSPREIRRRIRARDRLQRRALRYATGSLPRLAIKEWSDASAIDREIGLAMKEYLA